MHYFLYLINVGCSAGQSALSKGYAANGGNSATFNVSKAFSGLVLFLLIGLVVGLKWHLPTVALGSLYGVFLSVSNYTGFKALAVGSMALSSVVASFSLIIPVIFGVAVWGETVSGCGILGSGFLCVAIVMINMRKESGINAKWAIYAFVTMLSNGFCSVIQKYHQICFPKAYRIEFTIVSLLCVLLTTIIPYARNIKTSHTYISLEGLAAGVMNGFSGYIVLSLAATENASILFPVVAVANIIAACLVGRFAFRERIRPLQIGGIMLGMLSILLLNIK